MIVAKKACTVKLPLKCSLLSEHFPQNRIYYNIYYTLYRILSGSVEVAHRPAFTKVKIKKSLDPAVPSSFIN